MRFDRGFFGFPFFLFPPFFNGRRDRGDFDFDERNRRRDNRGNFDNRGNNDNFRSGNKR
jgi:hypothetical protein